MENAFGIEIIREEDAVELSTREVEEYADMALHKFGSDVRKLTINYRHGDPFVILCYELKQPTFERVRRITGYLVGTLDKWNNAKRAEERDRIKHGLAEE